MLDVNSWVEISESALLYNISQFRKILPKDTQLSAVVKSNAYGHGMIEVAKTIATKVDYFCTVNLEEALLLRKNNIKKPILVLSFYFEKNLAEALKQNIELVVYRPDQLVALSKIAKKLNKKAKLHLKVETGIGRLGVKNSQALLLAKKITSDPNLKLIGVFSHFSASEENKVYTDRQLKFFNQFLAQLKKQGISHQFTHFASSAATLVREDTRFSMVRLGIALYGLWPSDLTKRLALKKYPNIKLKPVLIWKTKIILIKNIPANSAIGYGCTRKVVKKTKVAILPIGYFDGYDRLFSNQACVLIQNKKCSVLGRVAMNLTIVDVSKFKNVKINEEVILLNKNISAEILAQLAKTINYEIVTRINPNLTRILVK